MRRRKRSRALQEQATPQAAISTVFVQQLARQVGLELTPDQALALVMLAMAYGLDPQLFQ